MNAYLRHYLASSVFNLARPAGESRRLTTLAKQHLPYALMPRPDGSWVVCNREYKPLGWPPHRRSWLDYSRPMFDHLSVPASALRVPLDGRPVMLYAAPALPWRSPADAEAYRARLVAVFGPLDFSENGDGSTAEGDAA